MATAGRKRTPTALKLINGNPGNRPLPSYEPTFKAGLPQPPDDLVDETAVGEWNRVVELLHEAGVLTQVDMAVLLAYCQAFGRWWKAERELRLDTLTVMTEKGNTLQNPLIGIANTSMRDAIKFAAELGMTPASRSRVTAIDPDGKAKKSTTRQYF